MGYNCHMAAMHWAFMVLGQSQAQANARVAALSLMNCRACNGQGILHATLPNSTYGMMFCGGAQQIPGRGQLDQMAHPGDVLITGTPADPTHSMVVRQNKRADHVTARGFNNTATLGTGGRLQYDPVSHNITKDKYWHGDAFGNTGAQLWVVPYAHYINRAQHHLHWP